MAGLAKTLASLRFFGDDLDPDEVTTLLGCEPTSAERKGGKWITARGIEKVSPRGSWRLVADECKPGDLDHQIAQLLGKLTEDLGVWRDLTARFKADVFCGLFMEESNEGLPVSPNTLEALGVRNLVLDFDIYGSSKEDG